MKIDMARTLFIVTAITYAVLLFINWPQISDPFIRHDDYPAYFGQEWAYYEKTLSEGRWLNYLWMSREPTWPANLAFLHYLLGWAIFCASAAVVVLATGTSLTVVSLAAILIALSPQAYLISAWFNTLGLAVWMLALFGLVTAFVSARSARWALLIIGPVSMLAYTTYPLLMSLLLFAHRDAKRSIRDAFNLMVLLAVTIVLGLVLMYSINYAIHGVFGLQIADWRLPTPARDLESLLANTLALGAFFQNFALSMGYGIAWLSAFNFTLLIAAFVVVARHDRLEALYLGLGLAAAIGVLAANGVKEGVEIPVRAALGAWGFFAIVVVRAVVILAPGPQGRVVTLSAALLAAYFAGHLQKNTRMLSDWLVETQALAEQLPPSAKQFVVYGHLWSFPGAVEARISRYYAFSSRMTQLTGMPGVYCDDPTIRCLYEPPFDPDAPDANLLVQQVGDTVFLRMPARIPGQWHPLASIQGQADSRT